MSNDKRTIQADVYIGLLNRFTFHPQCKECARQRPSVLRFATGWRAKNYRQNLTVDNLEPACDQHKDEFYIERIERI